MPGLRLYRYVDIKTDKGKYLRRDILPLFGFGGLDYVIAASLFYMEVVKVGIAVGGDYVGAGAEDTRLGSYPCAGHYGTVGAERCEIIAVEAVGISACVVVDELHAEPHRGLL